MNKDIAIKVENLSKVYKLYNAPIDRMKEALHPFKKNYHKEFYALNDVSFEIKKGETVGIIGKNGSGKSTILKIIAGILSPSNGRVLVNGKISALLELGAGFNAEYTGMENIYFQGSLMGFERKEMDAKVQEILDFADIGDFIHQPVKNYSSGMFSRLAFAVAINVEPDILIVDEALSVGDMLFQQKCLYKMKKMMSNGVTVLFVSHSLAQVRSLCRKAVYLKNGVLSLYGESPEVCDLYMNDSTSQNQLEKNIAQSSLNKSTLQHVLQHSNSRFFMDDKFESVISERSGGQEISFVSLRFFDSYDKQITEVYHNQSFKIAICFIVNEDIPEGSSIGVHITDKFGNSLLSLNTNYYNFYLPRMHAGERHCLELDLIMPLINVELVFGLGCKPDPFANYFYDRVFGCAVLQCVNSAEMKEKNIGGIYYIEDLSINLI